MEPATLELFVAQACLDDFLRVHRDLELSSGKSKNRVVRPWRREAMANETVATTTTAACLCTQGLSISGGSRSSPRS